MKMGTHFKKSIFDEHVQTGLLGWAQKAKKNKGLKGFVKNAGSNSNSNQGSSTDGSTVAIQIAEIGRNKEPAAAPSDGSWKNRKYSEVI